ncbi:unnamed protein product [Ilex paraguariensis]|uniref:Rhamnogalacturonan endolyase n=1 Tax=Ilex paraguariensis TaxID=185542 RepID=A0ABC8UZP9_9AQUA
MGVQRHFKTIVKNLCTCGKFREEAKEHSGGLGTMAPLGVRLHIQDRHVMMDNGIVQVTLSNPDGIVTGVRYNGMDNLLEVLNQESNRGIKATDFKVIMETEEQVEVSFSRPWDPSLQGKLVPLNIDKRFILLRGCSGFYSYAIYEHLGSMEWPAFSLGETRIAFKLRKDKFHYMAMADNKRRFMPLPDDRNSTRCQVLAYPEAVLLVNPVEPELIGEVMMDNGIVQVTLSNPDGIVTGVRYNGMDNLLEVLNQESNRGIKATDFKVIMETEEQVEVSFSRPWDPSLQGKLVPLNIDKRFILLRGCSGFYSYAIYEHLGSMEWPAFSLGETRIAFKLRKDNGHYAGDDLVPKFGQGEPWKKVFGPVFIYVNSVMDGEDPFTLWDDAKNQMLVEVQSWPYSFPASEDFPFSDQRGNVSGRLLVRDGYVSDDYILGNGAYVGLAPPGEVGSWQRECKDYQFWTKADDAGYFSINDVRAGNYNLYAWVPGFVGDYRNEVAITVTPGSDIDMGEIIYEPPRDGPTLWEIGIPDRSAAEFYVPDPNPKFINKLFIDHPERYRQYGLWERYAEIYPSEDLVYTVGESDYRKDWFFAQVTRYKGDNTFVGTTWQVRFKLDNVESGSYKLRVALASAALAELQVRVNDPNTPRPLFTSGLIGRDNSIARHGIHGLYWLYNVDIPSARLVQGDNTIFLGQPRSVSPFQGLMYDYIRLESPSTANLC